MPQRRIFNRAGYWSVPHREAARRSDLRRVEDFPCRSKRLVQLKEVAQAGYIPPLYNAHRHTMAATCHSLGNPPIRDGWIRQPEKYQEDRVALRLPVSQPRGEGPTCKSRFECKTLPSASQIVESCQHQAPGLDRDGLWPECRETPGDLIGIDELADSERVAEQERRSRRLSRTIGTSQNND
jgi:hypothetical protein